MSVSDCLKMMDKHAPAALKTPLLSAEEVRKITEKLGMRPDDSKPARAAPKQRQRKRDRREWLKAKIAKYKAELEEMEGK